LSRLLLFFVLPCFLWGGSEHVFSRRWEACFFIILRGRYPMDALLARCKHWSGPGLYQRMLCLLQLVVHNPTMGRVYLERPALEYPCRDRPSPELKIMNWLYCIISNLEPSPPALCCTLKPPDWSFKAPTAMCHVGVPVACCPCGCSVARTLALAGYL